MSLQKLQEYIDLKTPIGEDLDLENLLPFPITEDTYVTILFAAENGIIDPLVLLQTSIRLAIESGPEYFQIIGMALRVLENKKISPNVYITVAGVQESLAVVHILYYTWLITPKTVKDYFDMQPPDEYIDEEGYLVTNEPGEPTQEDEVRITTELELMQNTMLNILAILSAGGCDAGLPVVDPDILLARRRKNASNPAEVSQADALIDIGIPRTVFKQIKDEAAGISFSRFKFDQYGEEYVEEFSPDESDVIRDLGIYAVNRMDMFYRKKDILTDLYDARYSEFEGPNRLISNMIRLLDRPSGIVLYPEGELSQGEEFIEAQNTMEDEEGNVIQRSAEPLSYNSAVINACLSVHANKCAKKIIDAEVLRFFEAERAMFEALDAYNVQGLLLLIDAGLQPKYNHVDRIILRAMDKKDDGLPFSSAIMLHALTKLVERGVGVDEEQLRLVYDVSPSTHAKIRSLQKTPYWRRTCNVPYGVSLRQDLRDLARELNLPPDVDKRTLCAELVSIDEASGDRLETIAYELGRRKLKADAATIGSMVRNASNIEEVRKKSKSPKTDPMRSEAAMQSERMTRASQSSLGGKSRELGGIVPSKMPSVRTPSSEMDSSSSDGSAMARSERNSSGSTRDSSSGRVDLRKNDTPLSADEIFSKSKKSSRLSRQSVRSLADATPIEPLISQQVAMTKEPSQPSPQLIEPTVRCSPAAPVLNKNIRSYVCKNAERLARPETDYADLDLVMVPEGIDTYCFETADYSALLERGKNPITGLPLTTATMREVRAKLDIIQTTGVPMQSTGILAAIKQVKSPSRDDEYEKLIKRRRAEFLVMAEYYEIDPRNFTAYPEDGGLENVEMMDIARELTGQMNITFDLTNREASFRSFTSTVMELVEEANALPKDERNEEIDDLFALLKDLVGEPAVEAP